jgi:hypothetical protein
VPEERLIGGPWGASFTSPDIVARNLCQTKSNVISPSSCGRRLGTEIVLQKGSSVTHVSEQEAELRSQIAVSAAYRLAGLRVVSDFPLSGLPVCRNNAPAQHQVMIRRAHVPEALPSIAATFPNGQYNGKAVLLDFPGVARFLLRDRDEILVDPAPSSNDGEVRAHLLGTTFGVLCHQRGIPPLHASAIDTADGCVAFVGESGAGKSTLVAALAARDYQVIADDVCFFHLGEKGDVQAWPGINRIRLWEDAMIALDCDGADVEQEFRGFKKYLIPVNPPGNPTKPRRLRKIYQLHEAQGHAAPSVSRLHGAAVIEVLMQNVYRLSLAECLGYKPAAFLACAAAARGVPVFRFSRRRNFDALEETVKFLEEHLLTS